MNSSLMRAVLLGDIAGASWLARHLPPRYMTAVAGSAIRLYHDALRALPDRRNEPFLVQSLNI